LAALAAVVDDVDDDDEDDEDEDEEEEVEELRFCCLTTSLVARAIVSCSFFLRSSICFFCETQHR
jgi:hypothetical protein